MFIVVLQINLFYQSIEDAELQKLLKVFKRFKYSFDE